MPIFKSFTGQKAQTQTVNTFEFSSQQEKGNLLTKVFGVMFISLLITAVVSYGLGYLFVLFFNNDIDTALTAFVYALIVSGIGLFVLSFVLPIAVLRGKHKILPYYVLYIVFMCFFLSTLFVTFDLSILALTFGITSLIFGIMAALGYFSKGSLAGIRSVILGLFLGSIILALLNFIIGSDMIAWIVSFAVFGVILLITMYDVWRIKELAGAQEIDTQNRVLYCALMLYVDFINIFIRLLYYLALITKRE